MIAAIDTRDDEPAPVASIKEAAAHLGALFGPARISIDEVDADVLDWFTARGANRCERMDLDGARIDQVDTEVNGVRVTLYGGAR